MIDGLDLAFWKQAADQAIDEWIALENRYNAVIEEIGRVLEDDATALSRESWHALEKIYTEATAEIPPETAPDQESADLGFGPMRIIEDETLRPSEIRFEKKPR